MQAKIKLGDDVEDIETTLTITMPLRNWKELAAQLSNKYPSSQLFAVIVDLIHKVTKQVETETPFEGVR